jgi:carbonic anhydrase
MRNLSWKEALSRLKQGNERFVKDKLEHRQQDSSRRMQVSKGQRPFAIILSCADSRVVPELAFDTGLGELFVIRVAGNVASTSTIASVEYAVANLGVNLILVMGHENCGAVAAAIEGADAGPNLNKIISLIQPAVTRSSDRSINAVVKENVRLNARTLVERSKFVSSALYSSDLKIITGYYNLETGIVDFNI